ncbi:hypothetical protein AB0I72_03070 [Nocardiopsis sp. NPDC049922]|uniref:hypothetical protein n=1 Tax=Nocardiopsis sp. NPDC049922 TaxID=3155157 RepID=UPI0033C32CF3
MPTAVAEPLANGPAPTGNPDLVLEDAVRQGVISKSDADLIGRTRLDRVPLTDVARERGTAYWQLAKRRSRAERRLTDTVHRGWSPHACPPCQRPDHSRTGARIADTESNPAPQAALDRPEAIQRTFQDLSDRLKAVRARPSAPTNRPLHALPTDTVLADKSQAWKPL